MEKKIYAHPIVEIIEHAETDWFCYSVETGGEHEEGDAADAAADENLLWDPFGTTTNQALWQ